MMTVLRNEGRWDISNVAFDGGVVTAYDKRAPTPAMRWIDYGLGGLRADALDAVGSDVEDLADLYHELAHGGSCSDSPRPSGSMRSVPPPRWPKPTPS